MNSAPEKIKANLQERGLSVKDIYKVTEDFPNHETYGLISQMRRAAVSLPSNISEGFRRYHNKEYKQFKINEIISAIHKSQKHNS